MTTQEIFEALHVLCSLEMVAERPEIRPLPYKTEELIESLETTLPSQTILIQKLKGLLEKFETYRTAIIQTNNHLGYPEKGWGNKDTWQKMQNDLASINTESAKILYAHFDLQGLKVFGKDEGPDLGGPAECNAFTTLKKEGASLQNQIIETAAEIKGVVFIKTP